MSTSTISSSDKPKQPRALRWLTNFLLCLGILLILGFIYQTIASLIDAKRYPPPGQLVDMGGYKLHLDCKGPVGDGPTVVVDAGLGGGVLSWTLVTAELSDMRVCAFDRAGMGWSDTGPKSPTAADRNEELHLLLQKAGIQPPYVMVGHSLGGAYAFAYLKRYPDEVAGLVLVDPGNNSSTGLFEKWVATQPLSESERGIFNAQNEQMNRLMALTPVLQTPEYIKGFMAPFGAIRLYLLFNDPSAKYPPDLQAQIGDVNRALDSRSSFYSAYVKEGENATQVYKDAYANTTGCGDMPILVLSASQSITPLTPDSPEAKSLSPEMLSYLNLVLRWTGAEHEKLAACSTQGQMLIVDSSHYMTFDQPGAVASAIRQVSEQQTRK